MSLKGNLRTMQLPDVLQWLSNGRKTGILHLRSHKGIAKKIFFREGDVLSTASSDPREYLGQFLISRGYLTEDQLNMAIETQLKTKIKMGRVLITVGIIEEEDLVEMLRLKARECLYELFLWEQGDFHFEELEDVEEDLVPIAVNVTAITMEGIRRKDEWARIQKCIPNSRAVPRKTGRKLKTSSHKPNSQILRTYESVDGVSSIEEIALHLHSTEFDISTILFKFQQKGIVEILEEKPNLETQAYVQIRTQMLEEAEKALDDGRPHEAENLFRYVLKTQPSNEGAIQGLAKAEELLSEEFFRKVVPTNAKLELGVPLTELAKADLTPQEGYIVSRINGEWDVDSILKVSPLPRVEGQKAIRKLLMRKLIRVRKK